jgi:mRNA interferase MazF
VGAEIRKTRPALILQNDVANRWSPITIVAAISSRPAATTVASRSAPAETSSQSVSAAPPSRPDGPAYPTEVRVDPPEGGLTIHSVILLNQVRSIDRRRLVKRLGRLRPITMKHVDRALRISLGLAGI